MRLRAPACTIIVAVGSLASCAGDPVPANVPVPTSQPPSPAASTGASASPTANSTRPEPVAKTPRQPPPLPDAPVGVDPEQFAALASLCAVAVWESPSGSMVGCRSTPPFDDADELPDGNLLVANDFSEVCFLDSFYRGSFSAPGRQQAILGLDACGAERVNDISPGNVVLAERDDRGWRVVAVEKSTNVRDCRVSQRPDRTLLVCADNIGAYSEGSLQWRFTLDFAIPEGSRTQVFAKLFASTPTTCAAGPDLFIERGVTYVHNVSERFADVDGDGDEDLVVTLDRAYTPGSSALGAKFDALCASGTNIVEPRQLAGRTKRFTLRFEADAYTLEPTETTAKLLEAWGQDAPAFWWNVR